MVLATGCFPSPQPGPGRQLVAGRDLLRPQLWPGDPTAFVTFDRPGVAELEKGEPPHAAFDLWSVSTSGSAGPVRLAIDRALRWPVIGLPHNGVLVMRRMLEQAWDPAGQERVSIATLLRVDSATGMALDRVPGVTGFAAFEDRYFYGLFSKGSPYSSASLVEADTMSRRIGMLRLGGFGPDGRFYFVAAATGSLNRWAPLPAPGEILRSDVDSFVTTPAGDYLVATGGQGPRITHTVHALASLANRRAPTPPACVSAGIGGNPPRWACVIPADERAPGQSGAPWIVNLADATAAVAVMPDRHEVTQVAFAPQGEAFVAWDPRAGATLTIKSNAHVLHRGPIGRIEFSSDGALVALVTPESADATSGPALLFDVDDPLAPVVSTPPGVLVEELFFVEGTQTLVLKTHAGTDTRDLMVLDRPGAAFRKLAARVGFLQHQGARVLAVTDKIAREEVGDLWLFDLIGQTSQRLAVSVAFVAAPDLKGLSPAAVVVRERAQSERDGLWLMALPP